MKVAIAGYGVEGQASYRYWSQRAEVTIVDERTSIDAPDGSRTILGPQAFSKLDDFDLIVRSPGVAPRRLNYQSKVWSATNECLARLQVKNIPVIGVTGSKGKGTTSSLIASILRASGQKVHLVGNIGLPALDVLAEVSAGDIVVYELSSFQLWDAIWSPQVAVVLPIEPDHLDVHADFEDYIAAKANIARFQSVDDRIIFHANNQYARQIAELSPATSHTPYPFELGSLSDTLQLPGQHNQENAAAAILAAQSFGVQEPAIRTGLANFKGLDHRLKFVGQINGVKFYDDSIATTPGSAIAAIKAFNEPKVIILGGSDKGADYREIIELCQASNSRVIAMGETGRRIEELCQQYKVGCDYAANMPQAVDLAYHSAAAGDVVILSPASASFDQYDNYAQRGEKFISAVQALANA